MTSAFLSGFRGLILAIPIVLLPQSTRADVHPFLQVQSGIRCPNLLHVQFVDLGFWMVATESQLAPEQPMLMVHLIAPPQPLLLRSRHDLVVPLESTLRLSRGRDTAVARLLASWFLPNIDDPRAAKLSFSLSGNIGPTTKWTLGLSGVLPKPGDVTTPRAWASHIGTHEVLETITEKLNREVAEENGVPWSLALLANSNSPEALKELRSFFERYPEKRALGAEVVLHAEYLARAPWDYLRSDIFPTIFKDITVEDGHWTLLVWYGFHNSLERGLPVRIEGGSWNEVIPLAQDFLDHLLNHQDFDKILVREYCSPLPDSITPPLMFQACDEYEMLLEICRSFGVSDQIDNLDRALSAYEKALMDPKSISVWPLGRGGAFSGPSYEYALGSYKKLKKQAIQVMKSRSRFS